MRIKENIYYQMNKYKNYLLQLKKDKTKLNKPRTTNNIT